MTILSRVLKFYKGSPCCSPRTDLSRHSAKAPFLLEDRPFSANNKPPAPYGAGGLKIYCFRSVSTYLSEISPFSLSMYFDAASCPPRPNDSPKARASATITPVKSVCTNAAATPS